mgnify:CR=1 FL=1
MRKDVDQKIVCSGVTKEFFAAGAPVKVLKGVDFTIDREQAIAIVGASGCGKSTLLYLLAGLELPTGGEIKVAGVSLKDLSEKEKNIMRNKTFGFVYQFHHLLPEFNAEENVAMPLFIAGINRVSAINRSRQILAKAGLSQRLKHKPSQMSGGERQRTAIARALACRPNYLLADEPTGELDTRSADDVFKALRTMCRLEGTTVVAVTHYPGVSEFVDRMVHIRDGRIASETVIEPTYQASGGTTKREYLVVDQVGRLQLPQESMEKLGFKGRAKIEIQADGALIQPPEKDA